MNREDKGFSLLELLLVLALIGLLSALIVPSLSNSLTNVHLKAATKKTAAVFRYAGNQAIAKKKPFLVIFDKAGGWLAFMDKPLLKVQDESDNPREAFKSLPSSAKVYSFPKDIIIEKLVVGDKEISEGQSVFLFYPNGSCSGGEVVLQASNSRSYLIKLDPIIGTAKIESPENEAD